MGFRHDGGSSQSGEERGRITDMKGNVTWKNERGFLFSAHWGRFSMIQLSNNLPTPSPLTHTLSLSLSLSLSLFIKVMKSWVRSGLFSYGEGGLKSWKSLFSDMSWYIKVGKVCGPILKINCNKHKRGRIHFRWVICKGGGVFTTIKDF